MIAYTVTCEIDDPAVAESWTEWLLTKHVREVCEVGALDAAVLRLDGAETPVVLEVRYHFASREDFAAYERDHAPRLRAEGVARMPPGGGVRLRRSLGEVLDSMIGRS
jgi:hypothetical protein